MRAAASVGLAAVCCAAAGCYAAGVLAPAYGCSGGGCRADAPAGGFELGLHYDYRRTVRALVGVESLPYRLSAGGVDLEAGPFLTTGLDVTLARWSWVLLRAGGRYQYGGVYRRADGASASSIGTVQGGFLGLQLMLPIPEKDGEDGTRVDHQSVTLSTGATALHIGGTATGDHWLSGSLIRLEGEVGIQLFHCMFVDEKCSGYLLRRE